MIKKLILFIIAFTYSIGAYAKEPTAEAQLTQLLNNFTVINANFTQTIINKTGAILQEQKGRMQLKKPNLLRWETLTPDQMLIISDGKKIWSYDKDLEQVIVKNFSSEIVDTKIASLLLGDLQKMLLNFDVTLLEEQCNAVTCFELKTKNFQQEEAFVKAELGFNDAGQLVMLKLYDQLDQETEFNFHKIKNKVDPNAFKFTVPKGVDLIED